MTDDEQASGNIEKAVIRKIVFRLFPLMIILTMVNFLDRVNIGYAALTMNHDLGIDPAVFGLAAGVFFLGYILFEIPSNILLHKVGANVWLCRIMVTWGLVSMGMAFVTGPAGLYALRLLLGIAEAGFIPGITLYILLWVPLRQRARLTGLWILATPFAGILGGPLSGLLLQLDGAWGLHGWQWLFVVEGLPAVLLGAVTYLSHSNAVEGTLAPRRRTGLARGPAQVGKRGRPGNHVPRAFSGPGVAQLAGSGPGPALHRNSTLPVSRDREVKPGSRMPARRR